VRLPPKTSSFKAWAEALSEHAGSRELGEQREHWRTLPREAAPLPTDHAGSFTEDSTARLTVRLPAVETDALLHRVPSAYGTRTEEVLLAAVALGLTDWVDSERMLLGLERHGREAIGAGIDLSRTVGWFTSYFPLWLDVPSGRRPAAVLRSIKEQVRGVPGRGLGYGILRYLGADADTRAELAAAPQPQVIVSYAGRTEQDAATTARLRPRGVPAASRSGMNRRGHLLEIGAFFEAESLRIDWSYSSNVHARETITRVAEGSLARLRELIEHCLSDDAGGYTPSDFPDAGLSQEELDRLLGDIVP
jgi:non-ribosomal peptide synthase protein (TIGR01720 family)